jgi:hypothetical protein
MKAIHRHKGKQETLPNIVSLFFDRDGKTVVAKDHNAVETRFGKGTVELIGDDGRTVAKLKAGNSTLDGE